MRYIFRKIKGQEILTQEEYYWLRQYIKTTKANSPESWNLFYQQYANQLARYYCIYLSPFNYDLDDLYEYLIQHSELLEKIEKQPIPYTSFPAYLHEYLLNIIGETISYQTIKPLIIFLKAHNHNDDTLPMARKDRILSLIHI